MITDYRQLLRPLDTAIGHYPEGATVTALEAIRGRGTRICLDMFHMTGRCHTAIVPAAWMTQPVKASRTTRRRAA